MFTFIFHLESFYKLFYGGVAGFLSICCGGKTNYTDQNIITWVTDAGYDIWMSIFTIQFPLP